MTRPVIATLCVLSLSMCLFSPVVVPVVAAEGDEIPEEARKRLDYHVGEWEVRTEYLDEKGAVYHTSVGHDVVEYVIDGRVIGIDARMPEFGTHSRVWMFYNVAQKRYTVTSVDQNGDLWILSGGLDEYVITSEPKKRDDGTEMVIRFTHHDIEPDSFQAYMEMTTDGGETWKKVFRQTVTRKAG